MSFLNNIDPTEFVLLTIFIGLAIADDLNQNELNALGNAFSTVGSILQTKSAQLELLQNS